MRRVLLGVLTAAIICAGSFAAWSQDTYVRGYFRSDGTYVQPHYRSAPDNSFNNNWSVSPNVNPYTGQRGTRQPTWNDRAPSYGLGRSNSFGSGTMKTIPTYKQKNSLY